METIYYTNDTLTMEDNYVESYRDDLPSALEDRAVDADDLAAELEEASGIPWDSKDTTSEDYLLSLIPDIQKDASLRKTFMELYEENLRKTYEDDYDLQQIDADAATDRLQEDMEYNGLLKESEPYLVFGSNMGWRQLSGTKCEDCEDAEDVLNLLHGDYDCTITLVRDDEQPYLTATVSSHDAPMGESYTLIPAQWLERAYAEVPELKEGILNYMRQDSDFRDIAMEHIPALDKKEDAYLTPFQYAVLDAIDNYGKPLSDAEYADIAKAILVFDSKAAREHFQPIPEFDAYPMGTQEEYVFSPFAGYEPAFAKMKAYCSPSILASSENPLAERGLIELLKQTAKQDDYQELFQTIRVLGADGNERQEALGKLAERGKTLPPPVQEKSMGNEPSQDGLNQQMTRELLAVIQKFQQNGAPLPAIGKALQTANQAVVQQMEAGKQK